MSQFESSILSVFKCCRVHSRVPSVKKLTILKRIQPNLQSAVSNLRLSCCQKKAGTEIERVTCRQNSPIWSMPFSAKFAKPGNLFMYRFHISNQGPGVFFVEAFFRKGGHVRRLRHRQPVQNGVNHLTFRKIGVEVLLRLAAVAANAIFLVKGF